MVSIAQAVAGAQGTLGVALRVCTLPGKEPSDRYASRDNRGCRADSGSSVRR